MRWPVGGIRTHVQYNYADAAPHGYRFTFVGPDDESLRVFAESMAGLPGSEFVGAPVRGPSCRLAPTIRRLIRTGRFALIHSHGLTAAAHVAVANLGVGLPHVYTVHDPLRPEQFPGLRGRVKRWLLGRLIRRASAAVPVSQDIRANLLEYLPTLRRGPCRVVTIPNGIDTGRFADPAPADGLRQRLGLADDTLLLGFLGRFMVQKGFLVLLEAVERLVRAGGVLRFHLVAVGSGDYAREYRAEVRRRGLDSHVTMLDFVMDIRPVLYQLDLLVMPSLWEASSLLAMEGMCAGIPVLGTDCIGLREVLRGTPARAVKAGDPEALRRGLEAAFAGLWTAEAREFAPEARERFDNRRSARRLLALFEQVTAGRPA
jgi:glycosyltransferase involved in cell wall biosynthesis